jgi:hypothetical protein
MDHWEGRETLPMLQTYRELVLDSQGKVLNIVTPDLLCLGFSKPLLW